MDQTYGFSTLLIFIKFSPCAHTCTPMPPYNDATALVCMKRPETVKPNPSRQRAATYIRLTFSISIIFPFRQFFWWQREGSDCCVCVCAICVFVLSMVAVLFKLYCAVPFRVSDEQATLSRWLARSRASWYNSINMKTTHTRSTQSHTLPSENQYFWLCQCESKS